jgi:hypothetical protein
MYIDRSSNTEQRAGLTPGQIGVMSLEKVQFGISVLLHAHKLRGTVVPSGGN